MILAQSLTKKYGSRLAVSDLNFHVKKGEIVAFLGPNGAGKTTTMKILTGYMAPTEGEVYIEGISVFEEPLKAKKKLGYLPEIPPVYGDMTVEDYLKYSAGLKLCPRRQIPDLLERAIQKTQLQEVRLRRIQNLSKGFRQRTGLAQALVSDPELVILDEPTAGLDPKQVLEVRKTLKELKGHHTVLLSTHILSEAQISCDRVIIINEGKIVIEDSIEGLSRKMKAQEGGKRLFLKVERPSEELVSALKSLKGVLSVEPSHQNLSLNVESREAINEETAKLVIEKRGGLLELREETFNLEDLFIRLTNEETEDQKGDQVKKETEKQTTKKAPEETGKETENQTEKKAAKKTNKKDNQ